MKRRESAFERCQSCLVHSSTFIGLVYQEGAQELLESSFYQRSVPISRTVANRTHLVMSETVGFLLCLEQRGEG